MAISRRNFLLSSTAAVAAAVATKLGPLARSGEPDATATQSPAINVPVMLTVTDTEKGELEILVGEDAIPFVDRSLVRRLALATGGGRSGHVVAS